MDRAISNFETTSSENGSRRPANRLTIIGIHVFMDVFYLGISFGNMGQTKG
jgi:hypothetical protein